MNDFRPTYDCDTYPYWVSDEAYNDRERRFGRFIDGGRAYEIFEKNTPRPWLNYLCNEKFASVVGNDGMGFTFLRSSLLRVTKYAHPIDYLPREFEDGRELIIRDEETDEQWNVWRSSDKIHCVHRPGSSTVDTEVGGLHVEMSLFVPVEDPAECWMLTLRNTSGRQRKLTVRVEQTWTLAKFGIHTAEEGIPYLSTPGKDVTVTVEPGTLTAHSTADDLPFQWYAIFKSPQLTQASYEDQVEQRPDGRTFTFKVCRLEGRVELDPQGEARLNVLAGSDSDPAVFAQLRTKYTSAAVFEAEQQQARAMWDGLLESPSCEIPAEDVQNFLNVWMKNQLFLTFRFVRSGFIGYRDTLQDTWGYSMIEPDRARRNLLRTLAHMKKDGTCPRNYSIVDSKHDLRAFMDSGTWIPMALGGYIKETGDVSILDEQIPYLDDTARESVLDHTWKAMDMLFSRRGQHGMCLVGEGDWNDALEGISKNGAAVSAWLTMALFHAQNLAAEIFELAGRKVDAQTLRERSAELKHNLNEKAWDGEWYVYGFTGSGNPIGSQRNREGRIHLNAQTWSIFSGLADEAQTESMRKAMAEHLDTPLGPALLAPAYVEEAAEVGRIAKLEPGTFENGSIYQHAVTFRIFADVVSGHHEEAFKMLQALLPTNPENFDSRRTGEPYCTGNYYCGPNHPRFGQNFFSWFTGNAAWLLRIGFDYILGVRPELDGLHIEPRVPAAWKGYAVSRKFRGATYHVNFQRAEDGQETGVYIGGQKLPGWTIPPQQQAEVAVQVMY